nr:MAG TPA: hypothetical protein [Caudoviricetes sp.]
MVVRCVGWGVMRLFQPPDDTGLMWPAMSGTCSRRVFRLPRGCPLSLTIRSVRLGLNVLSW